MVCSAELRAIIVAFRVIVCSSPSGWYFFIGNMCSYLSDVHFRDGSKDFLVGPDIKRFSIKILNTLQNYFCHTFLANRSPRPCSTELESMQGRCSPEKKQPTLTKRLPSNISDNTFLRARGAHSLFSCYEVFPSAHSLAQAIWFSKTTLVS